MASAKAKSGGDIEACTSSGGNNNQANPQEKKPNTKGSTSSNLEKALVKRALFGSRRREVGSRRVSSNGVRSLPSRLSKVSLADEPAD